MPKAQTPSLIKKNTLLLATTQVMMSMSFILIPSVAPLVMLGMTGSLFFVGMTRSIPEVFRLIMVYPSGRLMDIKGRKLPIAMGWSLILLSGLIIFYSVLHDSLALFILGLMLFGFGTGPVQQTRIAAADMYPSSRKAEATGMMLAGSAVGALAAPLVVSLLHHYGSSLRMPEYAFPWLGLPAFALTSLLLLTFVRPDPQSIAKELQRYYPGLEELGRKDVGEAKEKVREARSPALLLANYPIKAAMAAAAITYGNMAMMMALVSAIMRAYAFDLTSISLAVGIHGLGMFAFAVPLGRLADRLGRKPLLLAGVLISAASSFTTPLTANFFVITFSIFLVGLGWSATTVATTALIADLTSPIERGRAIGLNDLFSGLLNVTFPLVGGGMIDLWGFSAVGIFAVLVSIPVAFLVLRLVELAPGRYRTGPYLPIASPPSERRRFSAIPPTS